MTDAEADACVICYATEMEECVTLSCACKASYCFTCIKNWMGDHPTCPLCTQKLVYVLDVVTDIESAKKGSSLTASLRHYQLGIEAFAKAQASQFHDKEQLKRASQEWLNSIVCNRHHPNPYTMMGYLCLLLSLESKALVYLEEAIKVAPISEHGPHDLSDAHALLDHIRATTTIEDLVPIEVETVSSTIQKYLE